MRLTNEQFAQQLGTGIRTVAKWNADPELVPTTEMQRALDTMLRMAGPEVQARFGALRTPVPPQRAAADSATAVVEKRLADLTDVSKALAWLDEHAGWTSGTARKCVAVEVERIDALQRHDLFQTRARVGRAAVARALNEFYVPSQGYRPFRVDVAERPIETSILVRAEWLDLALGLGRGHEAMCVVGSSSPVRLDETGAAGAVQRLAQLAVIGGRLVNAALYDMQLVDFADGALRAEFAVTDFLSYALTLDLLEGELVDAVAAGAPGDLPLRLQYLPDLAALTDVDRRLCAGGAVGLFAAARPGSRQRPGEGDYVFLVQLRSAHTVNANRKLAVIPKAFHQPLTDYDDDAPISATIEREMEEELFGREDLDGGHRRADPLHPSRQTEPMRWLTDHPESWRTECTGFGLNLVSGNYEFASLIVVEDEDWWAQFSGSIEANWEAEGLRRYSTLDREGIGQLVHDDTWSNEALFALLQGLRRLGDIGGARVDLPTMAMES